MPEEIGTALQHLRNISESQWGDFKIYSGEWCETGSALASLHLSIAWSGWGKVSSARAATRLLSFDSAKNPIDVIFFTGVAGSAHPKLKQWDIVISSEVVQHDMDARPLFDRYVIPALKKDRLRPAKKWFDWVSESLEKRITSPELAKFGTVTDGLIATGDKFINDNSLIDKLSNELFGLLAVEMEGAAVAQVAEQEGIPWLIIRVISDGADSSAAEKFNIFLEKYNKYSWNLIEGILKEYRNAPV